MQLDRMHSILLVYERGEGVTKTVSRLMKLYETSFKYSINGPMRVNINEQTLKWKICFVKKIVCVRNFFEFSTQKSVKESGNFKNFFSIAHMCY
jgi:hypothetical protein